VRGHEEGDEYMRPRLDGARCTSLIVVERNDLLQDRHDRGDGEYRGDELGPGCSHGMASYQPGEPRRCCPWLPRNRRIQFCIHRRNRSLWFATMSQICRLRLHHAASRLLITLAESRG
jgi:hypothetical protein